MERARLHVFYEGHVQGVGFRWTVKQVAMEFDVTGWVKNLSDGRVELRVEGERSELEAFQAAIPQAGLRRFILRSTEDWAVGTGEFRGFEITG